MTREEILDKLDDVYSVVEYDPEGTEYDEQELKDFLTEGGLL